ncbi:hypothetical protein QIS99_16450 [Streptomyces sp. B-S-A8]|uniref:Uncharacterized protein n=1 Tax=Streptomyces solicavernae TaxID=3043614 RepID=A0ABT6RTM9_9ACTN|nr:hypothetical protein [Streptomyces sp. B-S-A8]MDI3387779.1 hypothetical protein [Streptomyces sp. B-S-A8]
MTSTKAEQGHHDNTCVPSRVALGYAPRGRTRPLPRPGKVEAGCRL